MAVSEALSDLSYNTLDDTDGLGRPGPQEASCLCSTTVGDLSRTICSALRALLRQEMELVRREQADAAERREEKVHRLLAEQEQRLLAVVLQAGAADGAASPAGSARRHASPAARDRAALKLPLRRRSPPSPAPASGHRRQRTRSLSSPSAHAGRTPNAHLCEGRGSASPSPEGRDLEAPRDVEAQRAPHADVARALSRYVDAEENRAVTEGQVSLNSPSPAGTREWRHHVKGMITQKISRGSKRVRIGRSMGRIGHYLESLVARLLSDSSSVKSRRRSECVVDSMSFEMLCGTVILANVIAIGWRQDALTRAAMGDTDARACDTFADAVDYILVLVFVFEIAFRMFAKRWKYIFGKEWKWNVADAILATYCIIKFAVFRTYEPCFQIVRTLRLVRVVRAIRCVRVFRDVRLMVCSLSQSLVPLFSAFALLFVVIYLFSICFMWGAASYVEETYEEGLPRAEVVDRLRANYGNLSVTMYTLFLAISNGRDWNELAAPLGEIHVGFQALFMFYVLFVVIGVLNVLTSIFVERARELSKLDRDLATQGELTSQEAFLTQMRTIFDEVDDEKNGRITWQKFRDYLRSDAAQAFLATQQLDTSDAARLFSLMEVDDMGAVSVEEFALGCMRLRGPAKSSDVALLLRETKVQRKNAKMLQRLGTRVDRLCRILSISNLDEEVYAAALSVRSATASQLGRYTHQTEFTAI